MQVSPVSVRGLKAQGLVHRKLLNRLRILTVISVILLGLGIVDAAKDNLNLIACVGLAGIGFVLGATIFSHIGRVVWDEEQEMIAAGRMDTTAFAALVLYILFDIGIKMLLNDHYSAFSSVSGYIFTVLGASLLGRAIGTRWEIHSVARSSADAPEAA